MKDAGIFDAAAVTKLVNDHLSGVKDNRKQIWTLLMFEQWRTRYSASV